jgi:hypothetical protein
MVISTKPVETGFRKASTLLNESVYISPQVMGLLEERKEDRDEELLAAFSAPGLTVIEYGLPLMAT